MEGMRVIQRIGDVFWVYICIFVCVLAVCVCGDMFLC